MSFKKVSLYNLKGLRNELDEHIHESMSTLGFEESFVSTDIRLALGFISVALAGLMYWLEKKYKNNFTNKEYVGYTTNLVVLYFIVQLILFLYEKLSVEKCKYVGYKKEKKVEISTWTTEETGQEPSIDFEFDHEGVIANTSVGVSKFFYEDGYLNLDSLTKKLSELLDIVDKTK